MDKRLEEIKKKINEIPEISEKERKQKLMKTKMVAVKAAKRHDEKSKAKGEKPLFGKKIETAIPFKKLKRRMDLRAQEKD